MPRTFKAKARLLVDRGAAAVEEEFFRSVGFMRAEEVSHTLEIYVEDCVLRVPLKVSPIDGGGMDAISPYSYPGASGPKGIKIDPSEIDFSATGLVAIFLRHRLDEVPLKDSSDRNLVYISDPSRERYSRPQDRHQVKRNKANGFQTAIIHGPDTSTADRAAFVRVYTETMERRQASDRYFFSASYIERVLASPLSHLAVTWDKKGEVAAASIVVFSDGFMHYFLTGSSTERWKESPTKNLVAKLVDWSYELGIPLNFGGGLDGDEDKLTMFKRGFANQEEIWQVSKIICDAEAYRELSAGCEDTDFFPAYRATSRKHSC